MRNNRWCVLVVDDDMRMRKVISDYLKGNEYETLEAESGEAALELVYENNKEIDLLLLDVMMPDMDGFETLAELRESYQTPVIMLTARNEEQDQVAGLLEGADDYITKPFSPAVLTARIESVLRRTGKAVQKPMTVGKLTINTYQKTVFIAEKQIFLTKKEYDLLLYFIMNKGISLTRLQILDTVWDYYYEGDGRTVDTHVKQLRSKLTEECPYIKTIFKVGYRFEVSE